MPGGKQRTQNYKQRERNEDAHIEERAQVTDTEKDGLGARGGDASGIAGQSNTVYRNRPQPSEKDDTEPTRGS